MRGVRDPDPPVAGAVGYGATAVLMSVLAGCVSHDDMCEATGFSRATVHYHLGVLRALGLVAWEPRKQLTLQAKVIAVPFGAV